MYVWHYINSYVGKTGVKCFMQLKFLTQKLVKEKKIFPVKCEMFKMTQIAGKKKKKKLK